MKNIDICLISDSAYGMYTGVVIASALKNSKMDEYINFHIIDNGILEDDKTKILDLKRIKDCNIYFYESNYLNKKYEQIYEQKYKFKTYLPIATLCKIEIHNILKHLDKVIFLDCDIIVNKSLYNLYNIDINDYLVGFAKRHYSSKATDFNSGVMLLNLKKMRERNISSQFDKYLESINEIPRVLDQAILNEVLKNDIKLIDEHYNIIVSISGYFPYKIDDCIIIHYAGHTKPFQENILQNAQEDFVELYFQYLSLTQWFKEYPTKYMRIMIKQEINNILSLLNEQNKIIEKIVNKIAWLIPIKKLRDNFRNKILYDK